MTYVKDGYERTYANHSLVQLPGGKNLEAFQLVPEGGGWMQSTIITFFGPRPEWKQIAVTGDLCPGGGRANRGILSNWGYGLGWFGSPKSEEYLCEKFLSEIWLPEKCKAWLEDTRNDLRVEIAAGEKDAAENRGTVAKIDAMLADWESLTENGPASIVEVRDRLYDDLGQWAIDDGIPGYGYDPREAGLLCAAQQAFVRLLPTCKPQPIADLAEQARELERVAREARDAAFPENAVVDVLGMPDSVITGIVHRDRECPPDKIPLYFENGNIWYKHVTICRLRQGGVKNWPRWVKNYRLRMLREQTAQKVLHAASLAAAGDS